MEPVDVNFLRNKPAIKKLCIEQGGGVSCSGAECIAQLSVKWRKSRGEYGDLPTRYETVGRHVSCGGQPVRLCL